MASWERSPSCSKIIAGLRMFCAHSEWRGGSQGTVDVISTGIYIALCHLLITPTQELLTHDVMLARLNPTMILGITDMNQTGAQTCKLHVPERNVGKPFTCKSHAIVPFLKLLECKKYLQGGTNRLRKQRQQLRGNPCRR